MRHFYTILQAYLVSNGGLGGRDIDVVNLEIDEVELDRDQEEQRETLLASAMIHKEKPSRQRYICPIWTSGLERSFKVKYRPRGCNSFRFKCFSSFHFWWYLPVGGKSWTCLCLKQKLVQTVGKNQR